MPQGREWHWGTDRSIKKGEGGRGVWKISQRTAGDRNSFCHSRADGGLHPLAHPHQIYQKASTATTTKGDVRAK